MTEAIERLRALKERLALAPAYTADRAVERCPDGPSREMRNAYQAGALEQICRSTVDEIASIIRQLEALVITADSLTDEQITDLRATVTAAVNAGSAEDYRLWHDCNRALGQGGYERHGESRQRIADAINARAKAVR